MYLQLVAPTMAPSPVLVFACLYMCFKNPDVPKLNIHGVLSNTFHLNIRIYMYTFQNYASFVSYGTSLYAYCTK